jgi:hypothetical protein
MLDRAGHRARAAGVSLGWVAALTLLGAALAGCAQPKPGPTPPEPPVVKRGPLPTFDQVAARYNERVRGLSRLRTPIGLTIESVDRDGNRESNQVEGSLSIAQPRLVALRLDKVGQTLFQLGSNETHYWWIDLSGDEKVAMVGTHAKARADTAARFGLPVHPLDLIELLAITPLETEGARPGMRWSPDGNLVVVTLPGRWAGRRIWIDDASGEARRVELLSARGDVEVLANLDRYEVARIRGDTITRPRIATKLEIDVPRERVKVRITVVEPQNPAEQLRMTAFDLERQKDNFGVVRVIDLDVPPERLPVRAPLSTGNPTPPGAPQPAPTLPPKPASKPEAPKPEAPKRPEAPTPPAGATAGTREPVRPSALPGPREKAPGGIP